MKYIANVHDFLFRLDEEETSNVIELRFSDRKLTGFLTIVRSDNYMRVVVQLPSKFEVDVDVL